MKTIYNIRLNKLIELMKKYSVDKLLIQNKDEYQSEYTYKRRVEWLCNFTGSNATLILTSQNKHHFFTDGRYMTQAQKELDNELYQIHDISNISPHKWLERNLLKQEKLGYEEQLFTLSQVEKYQNFNLKSIQEILIDNFFNITEITQKIISLPLCYCGISIDEKIENIVSEFNDQEEAALITDIESLSWLTNTRNENFHYCPAILARAILYKDKRLYLFTKQKEDVIQFSHPKIIVSNSNNFFFFLNSIKNLIIDKKTIPMSIFNKIIDKKLSIKNHDICIVLKSQKNSQEIQGSLNSHKRDGVAVINFLHWLNESLNNGHDVTELSAEKKLLFFRKQQDNFQKDSFATISAFAENAAIIHYQSREKTNKLLKGNGLYLIDSGGQYLDGTTDITRTVAIGQPTSEQKDNFTRVLKGHIALSSCIFPEKTTGGHLDVLARQYLWREGLDYNHATGHGVGSFLSVHEGPQAISHNNNFPLMQGMIVSNEPGYYKIGKYGIRIENLMYIKKNSNGFLEFVQLTCVPIDRRLINIDMLTKTEIQYIDNYHKSIYEKLSERLYMETKLWLKKQCAEIKDRNS